MSIVFRGIGKTSYDSNNIVPVPVSDLEPWPEEILVEQLVSLSSTVTTLPVLSELDGRIDDSFPFEMAYTVQKFGTFSEILADKVCRLENMRREDAPITSLSILQISTSFAIAFTMLSDSIC